MIEDLLTKGHETYHHASVFLPLFVFVIYELEIITIKGCNEAREVT